MSYLNINKKQEESLPTRICASILCAFLVLFIWGGISKDLFYKYDYYYRPHDYLGSAWDGLGITIMMGIGIYTISILFIWNLFKIKWRLITSGAIILLIVTGGLINAYHYNMLEVYESDGSFSEINLAVYEPFIEGTLAKNLDEVSSLTLQTELPRLDGATALYPLYSSFARATYPMANYKVYDENSGIVCSRTSGAFDNLLEGKADIIFLMGISDEQRKQADEHGLELVLTPIGKEAFVFFVNRVNPISDLSVENIKDIYSGNINNWKEVGGANKEILAYQRPESSGSQIMLREIMGDIPIIEAPEKDTFDMMLGMYMAVAYKNHTSALGYSFLFYIKDMIAENKIKFLAIDGIEPTTANIANGAYPFAHEFYAITAIREYSTDSEKARANNTQRLLEWIISTQGQSLVEKTGYTPLTSFITYD